MIKKIKSKSRTVIINNMNTAKIFESRLFVNHGETATLTHADHKTLKGAERWASKVLTR